MGRRIWIYSITIIFISVIILVVLYASNSLTFSNGTDALSDSSASDVMTIDPHYLSMPPYYPNNTYKITKIFLESANLWYDYSNVSFTNDDGYDSFRGVPAVIINATIRNDYSVEEIIQFSQEGISSCTIGIDVLMYDEQGNIVGTLHQGNPFRGSRELSLKSGEKASVDMIFATPNRNINDFQIYVSYFPVS